MDKLLTIGMATYDDYDGVFFSIQSLRMFHDICNTDQVEFIVLDNNSNSEHGKACKSFVENQVRGKYIVNNEQNSSFNKYKIVDYASGKYVLIIDCHVLIEKNGIDNLLKYFQENPNCKNLIQGPLWYDDLKNISTHFDPTWRGDMFGVWATNREKYDTGLPFEIPMQGMGLLSFERSNWVGINKHFKGFGAEEGYIAEKFKRNGGKNICLPYLKWNHRFGRPNGVKYPLILEDRIWNYFVGWLEITKNPNDIMIYSIYNYFRNRIPKERLDNILNDATNLILGEQNATS
jgi:glycosyltransferase involved in cell wall biosynthesis